MRLCTLRWLHSRLSAGGKKSRFVALANFCGCKYPHCGDFQVPGSLAVEFTIGVSHCYFPDEGTEVQRGQETCLKAHSKDSGQSKDEHSDSEGGTLGPAIRLHQFTLEATLLGGTQGPHMP